MTATKAVLPVVDSGRVGPLTELAVWLSNPRDEELTGSGYSEGTFLYLIEGYWGSDRGIETTFSGFSAFAALLMELSAACSVPKPNPLPWDREHDADHPLELLRKLGASIRDAREIEVLYRLRYLTDEQFFADRSGRHRSNDAFGYPLFIAAD